MLMKNEATMLISARQKYLVANFVTQTLLYDVYNSSQVLHTLGHKGYQKLITLLSKDVST